MARSLRDEDGPNLVTMAMNGWAEPEPAWWLNRQAHPDATVALKTGTRAVHGRAAEGQERGAWPSNASVPVAS